MISKTASKMISDEKVLPSVRASLLKKKTKYILISRILVDTIPCFKPFASAIEKIKELEAERRSKIEESASLQADIRRFQQLCLYE